MKYIYFGTPEFSRIILEKLVVANFVPTAVVTNPDRPTGRKKILTGSPIKVFIQNLKSNIQNPKILQPEHLDHQFIQEVKKIGAEIGVLAAYGKIIPQELIDVFPKGIIVVHPSLLPKYRGATPIQSAILSGEKETGTTLIVMDDKVDHGPILAYGKWQIANSDNYEILSKKLADLSADLLIETLPEYYSGEIKPKPQNHSEATYTKKFSTEDGFVELEKNSPENIWRKVKALNPEPGVWTILKESPSFAKASAGKRMKILEADLVENKLILKKIQFEGEKIKSLSE